MSDAEIVAAPEGSGAVVLLAPLGFWALLIVLIAGLSSGRLNLIGLVAALAATCALFAVALFGLTKVPFVWFLITGLDQSPGGVMDGGLLLGPFWLALAMALLGFGTLLVTACAWVSIVATGWVRPLRRRELTG